MAAPIPVSRKASSDMAGLIALLVLLLLLGGEYYFLVQRDELRRNPPPTQAQLQESAREQAAAKAKAEQARIDAAIIASRGKKGIVVPPPAAAPAPATNGPDLTSMFNQGGSGQGPGFLAQAATMAADFEAMGGGLGLRLVTIAVCVGLLFFQKPPPPKVGAPRRYAKNPKTVVVPLQVCGLLIFFFGIALLGVGSATGDVLAYGFPLAAAVCVGCGFVGGQLKAATVPVEGRLMAERVRRDSPYGVVLCAEAGRFVNVPNPFRGTLVLGGAGAGKTYSIGEPFLEQFLQKGMCGIIYDFKFPVLAAAAQKALLYAQPYHEKLLAEYKENSRNGNRNVPGLRKPIRHRVVNFLDMERTEKVNPLRPQDMPTQAYAMEYAQTILINLSPNGAKGGDNFFTKSAQAYLTGIIWYYRNNYPALCTIPHVVATAVYDDFTHVLHMLSLDPSCQVLVQSLITAVKQGAEKQIAGVVASLQVDMSSLATAEISWVLSPDEDPGKGDEAEGFSLNLNDPDNPTLLTIGNDPTLAKTFSPVISCVVAVALKLMNQQYKHPSFVLIDEGATIYVPGLEVVPATARSNKVAMLYMTQDMAQLIDAYGKDKAQVLVSNLNNQFFGKINSAETARLVSDMVGKEDVEVVSVNTGQSMGSTGSSSKGQSVSIQEKQVVRVQDAYTLRQGEFIGQTVETPQSFFMALMEREVEPGDYPIQPFTHFFADKNVVDKQLEEKVAKATRKLNAALEAEAERARVEAARLRQALQQLEERERQEAARAGVQAIEPAAGRFTEQAATVTPEPEEAIQRAPATAAPAAEAPAAAAAREPVAAPTAGAGGLDPDWESKLVNATPEASRYIPSALEEEALREQAALSQQARARVQHQPEAARQQTEAQRLEERERETMEAEERRRGERTTQVTKRDSMGTLDDMIKANHARVYEEVRIAIENSGDNTLSKAGLAAAAQAEKAKAAGITPMF